MVVCSAAMAAEELVTEKAASPVPRGRVVRYLEAFAHYRYATWILAAVAFADSSFLPVAPDVLLIPMLLVQPRRVWSLSLVCVVASSLGAAVGYIIGYGLWSAVGAELVELYGYSAGFAAYQRLVEQWGVWIIIAKALTPIPFKIMSIAAGVAAMNPVTFMIAAVIGRALHFAMVAALVIVLGDKLMTLIARYERSLLIASVIALAGLAFFLHFR
jgi:membrane protein YqaA with SNARE-associated domain